MKSRPAFLAGVAAVAILASLGGTDASASHGARAGRIAFPMGTGNVDIYTVRPDGSDVKRLTTARGFDGCPAYSPDGRKIASCSDRTGRYQIWLMKADGSDQRRLSTRLPALFPQFSPDGRRIAFQADDGSPAGDDVYVIGVDGGKATRFTGAPGNDDYPTFSPDGRTIAFVSHRKPGAAQIWLMNASDGHHQRRLTHDQVGKDELPDWSPDGKRIVYEGSGDIWLTNANGSGPHAITHGKAFDFAPAWSPDGRRIAFLRERGPLKQVYVMNADGSHLHALYPTSIRQLVPAWQPLP